MKRLLIPCIFLLTCLLLAFSITAAEIPALSSDAVAYIAFHTGAGGSDENTGLTADAPRKTLSKTFELLPEEGGTIVVKNKVFVGADFTLPARTGAVVFTSIYDGVDYTENAGVDSNGLTNNVFKMAAGATLTFTSNTVLDNLTLYNEYAKYNTLRVTNGATLVIGAGVECRTSPALITPTYMAIEIESGSTVILNGGIFSSIRGEGVCINNGATICEPNPTVDNEDVAYIAYQSGAGGNDTNSGLTADAPRKLFGKTLELLPDGGTVVVKNKAFVGSDYTIPARKGVLLFTSNYSGVDYTDTTLSGVDKNGLTNNVFKMAAGKVLTFASDTILDNIVLYNEYANRNTLRVTNGATLVIGEGVRCPANAALSTPVYMAIEVEKGSTVVLNGGTFDSVTGEGRIINNGATINGHTDHNWNQGLVIKEPTGSESGEALYFCNTCYQTETRTIDVLSAQLSFVGATAETYADGNAAVRFIIKLTAPIGVEVENYGMFIAQNAERVNAKYAVTSEEFDGTEVSYAVDLVNIPKAHRDTDIFAWAFVKTIGNDIIVLPLPAVTVNGILDEMGV